MAALDETAFAASIANPSRQSKLARSGGFTLLELLTVITIILILAMMLLPAVDGIRSRAERVACTANLHSLFIAANAYVQQNGYWPQIPGALVKTDSTDHAYSTAWINALTPFNITKKVWVCPTVQRLMGNPDLEQLTNQRIDYLATPFDPKPQTPYKWSLQPWFVERGAMHGTGNLMIFGDGSVKASNDVANELQ